MATTEQKFNAAVNVIKNLPKDGPYQASYQLKLQFYAYFKQATEGPCTAPKPGFWDVVGKAKWEAWHKLGNMSKEEAMSNYINELMKIVETMSYNANVETFLGSLGNFYDSVPVEDVEMLLGPVIERVRSQPGSPLKGSPLASRETSPSRIPQTIVTKCKGFKLETSSISSLTPSPHPPETEEDEDEEYIDTVETSPHPPRKNYKGLSSSPTPSKRSLGLRDDVHENGHATKVKNHTTPRENGHVVNGTAVLVPAMNGAVQNGHKNGNGHLAAESDDDADAMSYSSTVTRFHDRESPVVTKRRVIKQNGGPKSGSSTYSADVSEPIREAVLHLQKDLDRINARIRSIEVHVLSQPLHLQAVELCEACRESVDEEITAFEDGIHVPVASDNTPARKTWWPFSSLSPHAALFMVAWPFVAHYMMAYIRERRARYCKSFPYVMNRIGNRTRAHTLTEGC